MSTTFHPPTNDPIDRLAPTRRPDRRAVMYQQWRALLFLHWEIDPDELRPHIPRALELDLYQGRAYVGLVPFTMRNVRPARLPALPWLSNFHETNVRTYVHNAGRDPGVWFFSLEAANPVAVKLARAFFHLPYHHARMSLTHNSDGVVHYTSRRTRPAPGQSAPGCDIRGRPTGTRPAIVPGSLEHFLLERYLLYCVAGERLYSGQVHHKPYPAQTAEVLSIEEDLVAAAGLRHSLGAPLAHFAEGVDVEIFPLQQRANS
jgi:uncharacterized protein